MCIWCICTLLGIAKVGSQTPPWSLQVRCPFPRDPPEPSQSQLWSPQGPPRTPLRAPKDAQGPLKSAMSTIKKRCKYVYLALKDHKKHVFSIFGPLLRLLGPTLVRTHTIPTHPMVLKSAPEPSQGPPWESLGPSRAPL